MDKVEIWIKKRPNGSRNSCP